MRTFLIIWFGQLVSLTGSRLTSFALSVWIFQETGSALQLGLVLVATIVPTVVISPFAGSLADRWDRRSVMLLADAGAGLSTILVALLYASDTLEIWHVLILTAVNSAFTALQTPAYLASVALLVPRESYGRVSGLMQFSRAGPSVIAPFLAGFLMATAGLGLILVIDITTFLFAFVSLLLVTIPMPDTDAKNETGKTGLLSGIGKGWMVIRSRPGLFGILILFTFMNLLIGVVQVLIIPLVLSFADVRSLGLVLSIAGIGMVIGSIIMSVWGGPRRRVRGIVYFLALAGIGIALYGVRPFVWSAAAAGFIVFFCRPFFDGSNQALTQEKVEPEVQGRVFALQQAVSFAVLPIGYLLAGPLADRVFEPLLAADGAWAESVGRVIGVGAGRGIGLIFILIGGLLTVASLAAYLHPRIRYVDRELPDVEVRASVEQKPRHVDDPEADPAEKVAPARP